MKFLQSATSIGLPINMVTNQSGVGRGYFTTNDMFVFNCELARQLDALKVCITATISCTCCTGSSENYWYRIPEPGMLLALRDRFLIELSDSMMIGDTATDAIVSLRAGLKSWLLTDATFDDLSESGDFLCGLINRLKDAANALALLPMSLFFLPLKGRIVYSGVISLNFCRRATVHFTNQQDYASWTMSSSLNFRRNWKYRRLQDVCCQTNSVCPYLAAQATPLDKGDAGALPIHPSDLWLSLYPNQSEIGPVSFTPVNRITDLSLAIV